MHLLLYDELDHKVTQDESTWPPTGPNIELSSFWVAKIAAANFIPRKVRHERWPVFGFDPFGRVYEDQTPVLQGMLNPRKRKS